MIAVANCVLLCIIYSFEFQEIDYNNRKLGFIVYKEVGQGYDVKWISFQ